MKPITLLEWERERNGTEWNTAPSVARLWREYIGEREVDRGRRPLGRIILEGIVKK
jgi:hypothetical protein